MRGLVNPKSISRRGFTLMELLIVIVILGILAAIVIPHTTTATADSRDKSVASQLQTLRRQVELYRLEHKDALPDLITSGWDPMTSLGTFEGRSVGPYLASPPENPLNGLSNVTLGNGSAPASSPCGYVYDFGGGSGTGILYATKQDGVSIHQP